MPVLIIDSSTNVADRLGDLVAEAKQERAIYKAVSEKDAIKLLDKIKPAVVLLDVDFSGSNAIEILKKIKIKNDKTVVIVLYTHTDERKLELYKEIGADFILNKYDDFEKIPAIISAIHKG